jgi:hypothetical protein
MLTKTMMINDMLNSLDEEDYNTAVSFIQYLSYSRKNKKATDSQNILAEIQNMFSSDKGWDSEDDMIADMAAFRKERSI